MVGYLNCVDKQKNLVFDDTNLLNSVSYFDRDRAAQSGVGTIFHPAISINNHTFRGEYEDPNDLFKTICSTMTKKPSICRTTNIN